MVDWRLNSISDYDVFRNKMVTIFTLLFEVY